MKRVKIMLATLAVLTVVGTALAFKASKGSQKFCTRSLSLTSGNCESFKIDSKTVLAPNGTEFYGFETATTANCTSTDCGSAKIRIDAD